MKVEVCGFDEIKELYDTDPNFSKIWRESRTTSLIEQPSEFDEYFIQKGMFFKGIYLCIPKIYLRLILIKEKHSGKLVGHFGIDKILSFLKDKYYWPQIYKDVQNFVKSCGVFQFAKEVSQNTSLYIPISIPEKP